MFGGSDRYWVSTVRMLPGAGEEYDCDVSCLGIVFRGLELTRIIIGSLWSLRRMKSVRYSLRQSGYRQWCPGHDRPFCTRNLAGDVLLERSVFALILLPQDAGTCRLTLLMV